MNNGEERQFLNFLVLDEKLKDDQDLQVDILHPIAFVHAFKRRQLEKQAQDQMKPMLSSAKSDLEWRRRISGLPPLKGPMELESNIY